VLSTLEQKVGLTCTIEKTRRKKKDKGYMVHIMPKFGTSPVVYAAYTDEQCAPLKQVIADLRSGELRWKHSQAILCC